MGLLTEIVFGRGPAALLHLPQLGVCPDDQRPTTLLPRKSKIKENVVQRIACYESQVPVITLMQFSNYGRWANSLFIGRTFQAIGKEKILNSEDLWGKVILG